MANVAPTYAEFVALYPGFNSVLQATVEQQISFSARLLDESAWGDFFSDAVGLDVAHNLSLGLMVASGPQGAMQGAAGPVTSASAAGMSASFAQPQWNSKSNVENFYYKTMYGQQFLRLRDSVMSRGFLCA